MIQLLCDGTLGTDTWKDVCEVQDGTCTGTSGHRICTPVFVKGKPWLDAVECAFRVPGRLLLMWACVCVLGHSF